jgi:hypothetical protein
VESIRVWLVTLGVLLALVGAGLPRFVLAAIGAFESSRPLRLTADGGQIVWLVGLVIVAVGLVVAAYGMARRQVHVALEGPYLLRARRHRVAWRFLAPTASDARVFAVLIRARLAVLARLDEKRVLPHDNH